ISFSPTVAWQPWTSATISLAPMWAHDRSDLFYVAQAGTATAPRYVLGALDRITTSLTTRLDLAFSPTLTLQLYGQPFLSGGTYAPFKDVVAPRARNYADRFQPITPKLQDNVYSSD